MFRLTRASSSRRPSWPRPASSRWAATSRPSGCCSPTRRASSPGQDGQPLLWHSPDPRMVLARPRCACPGAWPGARAQGRFASRSTPRSTRHSPCATTPRRGQRGTWITPEMEAAYTSCTATASRTRPRPGRGRARGRPLRCLARRRLLRRVDVRARPDASKVAFVTLVDRSAAWGIDPRRLPGPHRAPGPLRRESGRASATPAGPRPGARPDDAARAVAVRPGLVARAGRRAVSQRPLRGRCGGGARSLSEVFVWTTGLDSWILYRMTRNGPATRPGLVADARVRAACQQPARGSRGGDDRTVSRSPATACFFSEAP